MGSGEIFRAYISTITETSNDFLENVINNSFSLVRASYSPISLEVSLQIYKMDISELYSYETIIPYNEALTYVQNLYAMKENVRIYAKMYYSTRIETGFYVPCYKFYVDTGETDSAGNSIKYDIIRIPAVSFQQ